MKNSLTSVHPGILEEIPGVELEADCEDINMSAIEAVPEPDLVVRADAARLNANLTEKEPGVSLRKIAGVNKKNDVIVIDNDSSMLESLGRLHVEDELPRGACQILASLARKKHVADDLRPSSRPSA